MECRIQSKARHSLFEVGSSFIFATHRIMAFLITEAMKLFDQSKRTGVKVPFRTAILHDIRKPLTKSTNKSTEQTDTDKLWMAWPMLTGFSFTARCWGKILLSLPKATPVCKPKTSSLSDSPSRPSVTKLGVQRAALGGVGECGNVNYIRFHDKAFEQLVLADDKKELIRAVARNAGGGSNFEWDENSSDDDDEEDEIGLDVVANKGAASIFLLSGPPGKIPILDSSSKRTYYYYSFNLFMYEMSRLW